MPASPDNRRRVSAGVQLVVLGASAILVFLIHAPYFTLPYFWDEMGQFVPAALDILHGAAWQHVAAWVPHSTVPNVHPPGVMAYLAVMWSVFGYSLTVTRTAMLALAALFFVATFLLAVELCRGLHSAAAFAALVLLAADPLVYTQSMMAQLDLPAALFTVVGLGLFLRNRHAVAALACTALVLVKETGVLLPLLCGIWLLFAQRGGAQFRSLTFGAVSEPDSPDASSRPARRIASAAFYIAPLVALAAWLLVLKSATGEWLGDAGFAHYNVGYALHPVRIVLCLLRRLYFLGLADFRWVGNLAILVAWRGYGLFRTPQWRFVWLFFAAHVLLVSVLGGAELERYLLPVLPLLYVAMAAGCCVLPALWRNLSLAVVSAGLLLGLFLNPPFPFPYENNLAMTDFVELHQSAARELEAKYSGLPIYTAWPLTQALRDPAFGYVTRPLIAEETSDLRASTWERIDPGKVSVLVLYSRTWEPNWGVLRFPLVRKLLTHFYQYGPQMDRAAVFARFHLTPVMRWSRRGQWIEIYARNPSAKLPI